MRTEERLTRAYAAAPVIEIDEHSRFAFLSDCHRGDGSLSDEFTRNQNAYLYALEHYYRNGFTYVEGGDGDELWEHEGFSVVKDAHPEVFACIKRFHDDGRFLLLWGNHNIFIRDPEYVIENYTSTYDDQTQTTVDFLKGIVPREAAVFRVRATGQELLAVHGHQGDFWNDQAWAITMFSLKHFWRHLHAFGFRNPASPVRNARKRHALERRYLEWIARHKTAMICGHTHRVKFPRPGELPYFNTGCCIYPTNITAVEIRGTTIQLVSWRIVVGETGILEVACEVLRGPEPLERFDIR